MSRYRGFVAYPFLAVPLLLWFPIPEIPPWEMWFDAFGMYFGMAMLAAFTYFVLLAGPCFLAGAWNEITAQVGVPAIFAITFTTVALDYARSPGGPRWDWIIVACSFVAQLGVLAYLLGRCARALFRLARRRMKP